MLRSSSQFGYIYCCQAHVLKPSHKSTLQSKMVETVPDSVLAVQNATNATRDMESEGQEGKIREIVMDNVDSEPKVLIVLICYQTSHWVTLL